MLLGPCSLRSASYSIEEFEAKCLLLISMDYLVRAMLFVLLFTFHLGCALITTTNPAFNATQLLQEFLGPLVEQAQECALKASQATKVN